MTRAEREAELRAMTYEQLMREFMGSWTREELIREILDSEVEGEEIEP